MGAPSSKSVESGLRDIVPFGLAKKQKPDDPGLASPPPADTTKAMLDAYRFAETNKKLSASSGRKSFFSGQTFSPNGKTLMGA